eukprot:325807-Pyramimonas_sp.AAC.1
MPGILRSVCRAPCGTQTSRPPLDPLYTRKVAPRHRGGPPLVKRGLRVTLSETKRRVERQLTGGCGIFLWGGAAIG